MSKRCEQTTYFANVFLSLSLFHKVEISLYHDVCVYFLCHIFRRDAGAFQLQ